MNANSKWLIYGATGYTGKLIAQQAVKQGLKPVLAGRSAAKLQNVAKKLGLEWVAVDLSDQTALEKALSGVRLVINAAGPFSDTAKPMVEACLVEGVHYLDIANEASIYQLLQTYDRQARERGIVLMSGVGFGTVVTNFLAKQAVALLPDANKLEIAIMPYNYTTEPAAGADKTALDVIVGGGKVYLDGKLVKSSLGKSRKILTTPDGIKHSVISTPLGDLVAARLTTGIPNITAYLELELSETSRRFLPVLQTLLKIGFIKRAMQNRVEQKAAKVGTGATPRLDKHSFGWARVSNTRGEERELWFETGEGYDFTARSSVKAVERVLELAPKGALAPAQVFESDFARKIVEQSLGTPEK
jgi:short subunit dehydrogenase-like uncharacterized protein